MQVLTFFVRVMRPASVACWVSEAKTIRWIVLANGVAQNASFGARLCLENKTTHDGDRREAITRRSLVQIVPKQPKKHGGFDAKQPCFFLLKTINESRIIVLIYRVCEVKAVEITDKSIGSGKAFDFGKTSP